MIDPAAPKPPLRRASYVNVDKLVRSQYEIDLQLLTEELAKLKAVTNDVESEDGDNNVPGGGDLKKGTGTNKPNAWSGNSLSVLPGGPLRAPLPGKYHQSRLQPPRDGFNLCLLVGKVELVVDKYRVDGSRVLVAEVEVGDETGSISLRARDEQIDLLRQVSTAGGAIVLRNCTMELYQGKHLRLAVSKWGKLSVYPDGIESTPNPPSVVNQDLNFSLVDLNIVATTKMPDEPAFPMPVAMVHHKHKKQHQHAPKHLEESSSRGSPRNRRGSQGGGHFFHQKKNRDDWQYHRQQQQHQHHHRQQQRRPRSGSHMSSPGGHYQHQQSGGSASPPQNFPVPQMHYQQYSDAGSVYSYPSQQQGPQQAGSPHRKFLPAGHHYRQQQIIYQQYELQQRHAHQMALLQQQHESQMALLQQQDPQRRMLEQQQQQIAARSSLIPDLRRVESQESGGGEYPIPHTPVGGMGPPPSLQLGPGAFPPAATMQPPNTTAPTQLAPPPHPGMNSEYQWPSFQGEGQTPTYATIISPPMSPTHSSHPAPQPPPQYPDVRPDEQYENA